MTACEEITKLTRTVNEQGAMLHAQGAMLHAQGTMLRAQAEIIVDMKKRLEKLEAPAKKEDYYQKLLEPIVGGTHMNLPGVGITDITTPWAHVEIKCWKDYHVVQGQLAKYQNALPRDHNIVYFFGPTPTSRKLHEVYTLMTASGIKMYSVDEETDKITCHEAEVDPDLIYDRESDATILVGRFVSEKLIPVLKKNKPSHDHAIEANVAHERLKEWYSLKTNAKYSPLAAAALRKRLDPVETNTFSKETWTVMMGCPRSIRPRC